MTVSERVPLSPPRAPGQTAEHTGPAPQDVAGRQAQLTPLAQNSTAGRGLDLGSTDAAHEAQTVCVFGENHFQ